MHWPCSCCVCCAWLPTAAAPPALQPESPASCPQQAAASALATRVGTLALSGARPALPCAPIPTPPTPPPPPPPSPTHHPTHPLGPSGGPLLERLASQAAPPSSPERYPLTMPLANGAHKDSCNFSFSGLKTQVGPWGGGRGPGRGGRGGRVGWGRGRAACGLLTKTKTLSKHVACVQAGLLKAQLGWPARRVGEGVLPPPPSLPHPCRNPHTHPEPPRPRPGHPPALGRPP